MANKTHGWVLYDAEEEKHFTGNNDWMTRQITEARVFKTRKAARESIVKLCSDVVRKVRVDRDGVAVEIIKGR